MLYDPRAHVELVDLPWSEDTARETIAEIVDAIVCGWSPENGWPAHPDEYDEERSGPGAPGIYCGAAGTIWALQSLKESGYRVDADLLAFTRRTPQTSEKEPWFETSNMLGPIGMALVAALAGDDEQNARIAELVERNLDNPSHEIFIGSPGSMLAALAIFERFADPVWAELFKGGLERLLAAWAEVRPGTYLWVQQLYGREVPSYVGPGHGFAGNVAAMARGAMLTGDWQRNEIYRRAISTAKALAVPDAAGITWPPVLAENVPRWPMQWCHGAPGMVAALCSIPAGIDREFDRLLLDGGESTWNVGPLAQNASICHGTAGNGYTFLKLFERTGDGVWLDRARAFAMHAIVQMREQHERWKRPWFSLFTGDAGVARYLHGCIVARSSMLSLDND